MTAAHKKSAKGRATVQFAAGHYWVGDPAYIVTDGDWPTWITESGYPIERHFVAVLNDVSVVGFATAFGDGTYVGSDGFEYQVDSSILGIVPEAYGTPHRAGTMNHVYFPQPFSCTERGGVIQVGNIRIDTTAVLRPPAYRVPESSTEMYSDALKAVMGDHSNLREVYGFDAELPNDRDGAKKAVFSDGDVDLVALSASIAGNPVKSGAGLDGEPVDAGVGPDLGGADSIEHFLKRAASS
jgi:hypothetical protein